jgi:hypothetical protein
MFKKSLLLTTLLLFSACGGGASQHTPREEKSLYFVDAPTNGIEYSCGERSGITKTYTQNGITKHGLFKCVYSPVTFRLGSVILGSVDHITNGETIYPQSLVPNFTGDFNNEEVLKIAILLQSLDDKSSNKYLNISQSSREKITFSTLKNMSIKELREAIRAMGFEPVTKDQARVHLILNSPNVQSGKPTIKPFEEDISLELTVGNIIGKLNIDKGDADLIYPFVLDGEGKEHFMVNDNGKLILTQTLNKPCTFKLSITAQNAFGYTTVPLTIHVEDSGKIGKAQMGRLKGATVKIFKLAQNNTLELVTTETTKKVGSLNQIGNFDLHTELLEEQSYYVYEVSGGVDIDSNDDGVQDEEEKKNSGKLRLIAKGIWIKNATDKIRITPLSEMLYTYVERDGFVELEKRLRSYSKILLKNSKEREDEIDAQKVMIFNPLQDKKQLYPTLLYDNTYNNITQQLRLGNNRYKSTLFSAYVVDSFQANAIEIVGSSIYTIDMLNSGEFRIYDLETKALVGKLKLTDTAVEKDTHILYVNLIEKFVVITSLVDSSYDLNIQNQIQPSFLKEPYISYSTISGNFSRFTIGKSLGGDLFSKERRTYFYNMTTNNGESKKIKIFNTTDNANILLYEFDSKLQNIESFWSHSNHIYIIGENKMHIFKEGINSAILKNIYSERPISGNILGIENNILFLLNERVLSLYALNSPSNPQFIENINVPFDFKLGIKTNGKYITTGSQIIDISSLRASKIAN